MSVIVNPAALAAPVPPVPPVPQVVERPLVFFRTSVPNQVFYMPDGTPLRFAGSLLATKNEAEIAELRAIAGQSTITEGTDAEANELQRELNAMANKNAEAAAKQQAEDLAARVKAATGG